jgi:hypothetical protein
MGYDLSMNGIEAVIQQLEAQQHAIDAALTALREVAGTATPTHQVTDGNARSIAQKARWAAKRAAEANGSSRKGGLTAEGRRRLAENMKKRWAAKRTAAQAHKRARKRA